jgi:hypothetical protein
VTAKKRRRSRAVVLNTTRGGPAEVPRGTRESTGHVTNTTRIFEEDLVYEDASPDILAVLPGGGWCAVVDGDAIPLVCWVALDSGTMHGVVLGENGLIDLTDGNVEKHPNFTGYKQVNNDKKE